MKHLHLALISALTLSACGGGSGSETEKEVVIKNTPPTVSLFGNSPTLFNYEELLVKAEVSDNGSIASHKWVVSTNDATVIQSSSTQIKLDLTEITTDTTISVSYTATDNESLETTQTLSFEVDSIGELSITGETQAVGYKFNTPVEVPIQANFETESVNLEVTPANFGEFHEDNGTWFFTPYYESNGQNGVIQFTARHGDFSQEHEMQFEVDPTPPPTFTLTEVNTTEEETIYGMIESEFEFDEVTWTYDDNLFEVTGENTTAPSFLAKLVNQLTQTQISVTATAGNYTFSETFDIQIKRKDYANITLGNPVITLSPGESATLGYTVNYAEIKAELKPSALNVATVEHNADRLMITITAPEVIGTPYTYDVILKGVPQTGGFEESEHPITINLLPGSDNVTVQGEVLFESPSVHSTNGYDLSNIVTKPAYGTAIVAFMENGSEVSRTYVDEVGQYSLDVPANHRVSIYAVAEFIEGDSFVRVFDNSSQETADNRTNNEYLFSPYKFMISDSSEYHDVVTGQDFVATLDVNGSVWGEQRTAPVFNLLSKSKEVIEFVKANSNETTFSDLFIAWHPNHDFNNGTNNVWYQGGAETSHASFQKYDLIQFSDDLDVDSTVYNDSLVYHELGHFVQGSISRNDSIGGPHHLTKPMDIRVAFSEGFANWFSIVMRDNTNIDNITNELTYSVDLINLPNGGLYDGWFNEVAITKALYSISNNSSLTELDPTAVVLNTVQGMKETPYFTSVYTFLADLNESAPSVITDITPLLNSVGINSVSADGSGETYLAIDSVIDDKATATNSYLPVYTQFSAEGVETEVCVQNSIGGYENGVGARALGLIDIDSNGQYEVTVSGNTNDVVISFESNESFETWLFNSTQKHTFTLNSGVSRLWATDNSIAMSNIPYGEECFGVTISKI